MKVWRWVRISLKNTGVGSIGNSIEMVMRWGHGSDVGGCVVTLDL